MEAELSLGADALLPRKKEFKKIVSEIFAESARADAASDESDSASSGSGSGSDSNSGSDSRSGSGSESDADASPTPRKPKKKTKAVRKKKAAAPKGKAGKQAKAAADGKPATTKRSLSSYMIWLQEAGRAAVKAAHPEAAMTEVGKYAGELWRAMSDADKEVRLVACCRGCAKKRQCA